MLTDCISIGLLQRDNSRLQLESRNFEFKIDDEFPRGGGAPEECHVTIELNQSVSVFLIPVTRYYSSLSPSVCMEM